MQPVNFKISIPKPCHQNWEDMTQQDRGRHCAACNKVVVDFTRASDWETADFISKNKNTCGRFSESQLERTYEVPVITKSNRRGGLKYALWLALGLAKPAQGQIINSKTDSAAVHFINPNPTFNSRPSFLPSTISGNLGKDGVNRIKQIKVRCGGFSMALKPDSEGDFKFNLPDSVAQFNHELVFDIVETDTHNICHVFIQTLESNISLNQQNIQFYSNKPGIWQATWKLNPQIVSQKPDSCESIMGLVSQNINILWGDFNIEMIENPHPKFYLKHNSLAVKQVLKQNLEKRFPNIFRKAEKPNNKWLWFSILIFTVGLGYLFYKKIEHKSSKNTPD